MPRYMQIFMHNNLASKTTFDLYKDDVKQMSHENTVPILISFQSSLVKWHGFAKDERLRKIMRWQKVKPEILYL